MPPPFASCCANASALHWKRMWEKHKAVRGSEVTMPVPPLETERLLIRAFRLEDLDVIHHILDIELWCSSQHSKSLERVDLCLPCGHLGTCPPCTPPPRMPLPTCTRRNLASTMLFPRPISGRDTPPKLRKP